LTRSGPCKIALFIFEIQFFEIIYSYSRDQAYQNGLAKIRYAIESKLEKLSDTEPCFLSHLLELYQKVASSLVTERVNESETLKSVN